MDKGSGVERFMDDTANISVTNVKIAAGAFISTPIKIMICALPTYFIFARNAIETTYL
jgi:hypothetical protein